MVWLKAWPPWSRQASLRRGRGAITHMAARSVPGNRGGDFFCHRGPGLHQWPGRPASFQQCLVNTLNGTVEDGTPTPPPEETALELINKETSESTWALNQSRSHMWPQTAGPAPAAPTSFHNVTLKIMPATQQLLMWTVRSSGLPISAPSHSTSKIIFNSQCYDHFLSDLG